MKTKIRLCIYCCLSAFVCTTTALGQDRKGLSPKMELFKEYCLNVRQGVETRDIGLLEDCLKDFNLERYYADGDFVYKGEEIAITTDGRLTRVDSLSTAPVAYGNHLKFDPAYVDTLVATDLQPVAFNPPTALRSTYDCMVSHQVIPAGGRSVFASKGSGKKEMFVVAENGGAVNLTVSNPKNQVKVSDGSPTGKPAPQVIWQMPRFSDYTVEVENKSDRDISVIIVVN